MVIVPNLFL
jgi:SET domain-containing protein 6